MHNNKNPNLSRRICEAGNIFLMLFGAVGMVGVIGASTMTVMKGPVRTMSMVTKRTIAENNMIATGKLALISAATQSADCDADPSIEPIPWTTAIPSLTGGGEVPMAIGAAQEDPWGNKYGYCVWDHGTDIGSCGTSFNSGNDTNSGYVLAIISAGPDGTYQTTCNDDPGTYIDKTSGADDLVMGYTYAEAGSVAAGLWNLKDTDSDIAEIEKDLEVKNAAGNLAFSVGETLTGNPSIQVDYISKLSASATAIELLSALNSTDDITTSADLSASGTSTFGTVNSGATSTTTLSSSGAATLNSLGVTNAATIGGTLDVTSTSTLADTSTTTLSSSGAATLNSLGVTNAATIGDNLTINSQIISTTGTFKVPNGGALQVTRIGAGISEAIKVGGIHVGGIYTGSNPIDGEIVTSSPVNIKIKPGGTTAITLDATTQAVALTGSASIGGTLDMTDGQITNLALVPTLDAHATSKKYVDDQIASGAGFTETDPTITKPLGASGKICKSNGTKIECTSDEVDPKVGTITNGKWCNATAGVVSCTSDLPTTTTTALQLKDADNDTKIQVEEGTDDDTIRFDTAGIERMTIDEMGAVKITSNISGVTNSILHAQNSATISGSAIRAEVNGGGSSTALWGSANATSGASFGVYGSAESPNGVGIYGKNNSTSGNAIGIWGVSSSPDGAGIAGHNSATSGNAIGINAKTLSAAGKAIVAENNAGGTTLELIGGPMDAGTQKIINLADPTVAQDAATKAYVDAQVSGGSTALDDLSDATKDTTGQNLFISHEGGSFGATDQNNTAVGIDALISLNNSNADNNSAFGRTALEDNSSGTNNSAFGYNALNKNTTGKWNTAIGSVSLDANTTGQFNTATGFNSLSANATGSENVGTGSYSLSTNTTGGQNSAFGHKALNLNTTGNWNTAIGTHTLHSNTTGTTNTATGINSLYNNTTGTNNVANGGAALSNNTVGSANVAVGVNALFSNVGQSDNVAIGINAMRYANDTASTGTADNTAIGANALTGSSTASANTGKRNVGIGSQALTAQTSGSDNVAIGYQAGDSLTGGSNNILIGRGVDASSAGVWNELNIGNTLYGALNDDRIGIGQLPAAGVELDVLGDIEYTGTLTDVSDRRLKTDIKPLSNRGSSLEKISAIDVYSFRMKDDKEKRVEFGVMAQELEKIFPELVHTANDEIQTKSVNYIGLLSPIIQATKELKTENNALRSELKDLKESNAQILKNIDSIGTKVGHFSDNTKPSLASLGYGIIGFLSGLLMLLIVLRQKQKV